MDAATLHEAVAEVCPIVGTSVGNADDRETWAYTPTESATTEQIAAADNVVATIPNESFTEPAAFDFIARFTNAEYRAAQTTFRQSAGNAKNWDVVVFDSPIRMTKKKVQTLKTDLVAAGVLTQVRADEIFS